MVEVSLPAPARLVSGSSSRRRRAAAPDGDEVALHSRAHETNQSIRSSSGQFGQVCDVVVVPAILGASSGGRQKRPRNRPSLEWGWFFGQHKRHRDSVIDLLEEGGGVEGKEQECDRQEVGKREEFPEAE